MDTVLIKQHTRNGKIVRAHTRKSKGRKATQILRGEGKKRYSKVLKRSVTDFTPEQRESLLKKSKNFYTSLHEAAKLGVSGKAFAQTWKKGSDKKTGLEKSWKKKKPLKGEYRKDYKGNKIKGVPAEK